VSLAHLHPTNCEMPKQTKYLARGVPLLSRSASYKKSGKWAVKHRGPVKGAQPKKTIVSKTKKFGKQQTRTVTHKTPRFYPTDDIKKPLYVRSTPRPPKIRKSLVPGIILIVLSGRFRGKRVVLLKVLESGLLLITGPYKINGVPLRRVNPRYVIATSTKIDVSSVELPEELQDSYFKRPKNVEKKKKSADEFFNADKKEKKEFPEEKKAIQKGVDSQVLALVHKVPVLTEYLNAHFSLVKGQFPHLLKF